LCHPQIQRLKRGLQREQFAGASDDEFLAALTELNKVARV
jgi:hypothetical protein